MSAAFRSGSIPEGSGASHVPAAPRRLLPGQPPVRVARLLVRGHDHQAQRDAYGAEFRVRVAGGKFLLEKAVQIGSPNPEEQALLRLQLADALLDARRLDEAETIYRDEVRLQPNNPRALFGLGLVAAARGDHAAAVRHLSAVQSTPWTRKRATAQLAQLSRQQPDAAAEDMPADADWPDPLIQAVQRLRVGGAQELQDAARLERDGRYREAAALHLRRLEREPGEARHCVHAGLDLVQAGDYDAALPLLRRATQLDPDNCVPFYQVAWALHRRAEEERRRSPESARCRDWYREAAAAAEQALRRKPDHADACLIRGRSLLALGLPAEAVAPLRQGVVCRSESFELRLALGEALLAASSAEKAAQVLGEARQLGPDEPRVAEALKRLREKGKTP